MAKNKNKKQDSNLFAFITVFFLILGFIISILIWRKDKYVMFYAKQSLILSIFLIVVEIIDFIPFIGSVIRTIVVIGIIILWILTWINALSGKKIDTFLIGDLAKKFNF